MSRLIDADAFAEKIKEISIRQGYYDFYPKSMSVGEILDSVIADLKGEGVCGFENAPTVDAVPVVRCKDCIYYDPPHVEDGCERYEYSDMPEDAFDSLGVGLVNIGYGVNVGGRCCVDDMKGYSEDKRVFVSESNYCGRAIRKEVTE